MIQYISNPDLQALINDLTFILKLPVDPSPLKVSHNVVLNGSQKELKWHVQEIPLKGTPRKLKAWMPVDINEKISKKKSMLSAMLSFPSKGPRRFLVFHFGLLLKVKQTFTWLITRLKVVHTCATDHYDLVYLYS